MDGITANYYQQVLADLSTKEQLHAALGLTKAQFANVLYKPNTFTITPVKLVGGIELYSIAAVRLAWAAAKPRLLPNRCKHSTHRQEQIHESK